MQLIIMGYNIIVHYLPENKIKTERKRERGTDRERETERDRAEQEMNEKYSLYN